MERVCQSHTPRLYPELKSLQTVFENLRADLETHLLNEERVFFPLIVNDRAIQGLQMQATTGPIRVIYHTDCYS